jgi:uncharacterized membrane protein
MEIEPKPLSKDEIKAIQEKTEARIKEIDDKIKSDREKLEHRLEVENLKNNHGSIVGILALVIVILLGILLGTE